MEEQNDKTADENKKDLLEGVDFYFDEGLMVLTEGFLTQRGFCCNNDCRHCPYTGPGIASKQVSF